MHTTLTADLTDIASSDEAVADRTERVLERLREDLPFDAAWVALVDPVDGSYGTVSATDLDPGTTRYLSGPQMAADIERTQAHRALPPVSPSDLPYPTDELTTWRECLLPAGFVEALAAALFTTDDRHVGFVALLSADRQPPTPAARRRLQDATAVLARGIDPARELAAAARVLSGARAGVVLCRDGTVRTLPGTRGNRLLLDGTSLIAHACACLADGRRFTTFLWPQGDPQAPRTYLRVTVLATTGATPPNLLGAIVLTPGGDACGLTPRELEVLGLVIEGHSNRQIAHALVVTPRTVATHMEHIMAKLDAPTRTLAAVRADRQGLYVPAGARPR